VKTKQRILLGLIFSAGIGLLCFLVNYELIDAKEHVIFLSDESLVGFDAGSRRALSRSSADTAEPVASSS
jgi:hypothetical protein